jgi:hypothetical protein
MPLLLVSIIGTAGAAVAISTADRTSNAYGDFLERSNVGDIVINPSVSTRQIDEVIRELPGVAEVTSDTVFTTTFDDGHPRTRAEIETAGYENFARGSTDGRYTAMDRPAVLRGRMPEARDEAVIASDAVRTRGLAIGDVVDVAFWQPGLSDEIPVLRQGRFVTEVIDPIGREQLEIVGVVRLPLQALPDDLHPRADLIISPELTADYDCLPDEPTPGGTLLEALDTITPADCAISYRYYSLAFEDGRAGVEPALDEFLTRSAPMNERLAQISDLDAYGEEAAPGYFLVPTDVGLEASRVERAVRPIVIALVVLGLAAALVTVVLVGLMFARELRRSDPDQRQWRELAVGRTTRAIALALPAVAGVLTGLVVGLVIGHFVSPGAIGQAGAIDAGRGGLGFLGLVATIGLGVLALGVIAVLVVRSTGRTRAVAPSATSTRLARAIPASLGSPAVADGVRAAIGPRTAAPMIAASALIGGALVAAVVFGVSLTALVSTPTAYGWPWDLGAMTGFGYGDFDDDGAHQLLDESPAVAGWTVFGWMGEIGLDGAPVVTLLELDGSSAPTIPVLAGSMPAAADEIALGAATAAEHGLTVGDTVELGGFFPTMPATVTAIVVFPSIGPYAAERAGTGTGMLLPRRLVHDVASRAELGDPMEAAMFVGVDLRDGTSPAAAASVRDGLGLLDLSGVPAVAYSEPVRPPELIDLTTSRSVAIIVGAALVVVAVCGLLFASWASVRGRRRDVAVLRTFGFTDPQVRRSVRAQSVTTALVAFLIGAPLGVVVGRILWRRFAEELGVVPDPAAAWLPVAVVVVGGLLVALLVAEIPARMATRPRPAEGVRAE